MFSRPSMFPSARLYDNSISSPLCSPIKSLKAVDRFAKALEAAEKSDEAFNTLFEKKEANPNDREPYGLRKQGDALIHKLIKNFPDVELPALISILIKHGVDLGSTDSNLRQPLAVAARYGKPNAVKCLIENKANVNDPTRSALCEAVSTQHVKPLIRIAIIQTLIAHKANINIGDVDEQSPLYHAAAVCQPEIISLLIAQGADLFFKYFRYTSPHYTQYQTALGKAYEEYIKAMRYNSEMKSEVIRTKKCLDIFFKAAEEHLYTHGYDFIENKRQLKKYIDSLAGRFEYTIEVRELLEKQVLHPVLVRYKREQMHAFWMGSRLSARQKESKGPIASIYRFFQQNNGTDIVPLIFSYLYREKAHVGKRPVYAYDDLATLPKRHLTRRID